MHAKLSNRKSWRQYNCYYGDDYSAVNDTIASVSAISTDPTSLSNIDPLLDGIGW